MDAVVTLLSSAWTIVASIYLALLVLLFVAGRLAPDAGLRGLATSLMYRLFFLAGLLLLPGLLLKQTTLALALLLPLALLAGYYAPRFFRRLRPGRRRRLLRIASFNIEKAEGDPAAIAAVIRDIHADVIALQEVSRTAAAYFQTHLGELYPYRSLHPQDDPYIGQGLLSRFPIQADEYWYHPELAYSLGHLRVELNAGGTPLVIYNTHPATPVSWVKGFTTQAHHDEIADVLNRAGAESAPVILLGDFNMTTHFEEYQTIVARYTDAFLAVGDVGFGFTHPAAGWQPLPPFLRLDYIFYDRHFEGVSARVWPSSGTSDHYPLVAELTLRRIPRRRAKTPPAASATSRRSGFRHRR